VLLLLRLPARVEFSETLRFVQDRVIDLHAINHFSSSVQACRQLCLLNSCSCDLPCWRQASGTSVKLTIYTS